MESKQLTKLKSIRESINDEELKTSITKKIEALENIEAILKNN